MLLDGMCEVFELLRCVECGRLFGFGLGFISVCF